MRDAADIHLDQLIVHILDPVRPNGLILSQRTLPLEREPRLTEYFINHIKNSLQDPAATAARFRGLDGKTTAGVCRSMVDGSLGVVEGSQRLADRLYQIITADRRISSGDLAVCFYRAGNYPHVPRYLALLKLDPSEVFRHKTERDPQGHLYVRFELEADVLPTTRERLQKCAFVQPLDPHLGYDMMLLDRQVRPPVPRPVAKFFSEDFLGTEPAFDARKRTDYLYRSLVSARNQLHLLLKAEEDDALRQAIDTAVSSAFINVDAWIEALPLSAKHKEHINQVVSQELPDREFEVDSTYLQELTRKRRFRGDHGLRVEVSAARYSQVIQQPVDRIEEPGVPPYYRVIIHTERWDEVPR